MSGVHVRVEVAREHYAIPVEEVLEVAEVEALTPVPGAPPEIVGIQNLHGQVMPVVGLAVVLGLAGAEPARIVVAESAGRRAGLAVDAVVDVGELPPPSTQPDSPFLSGASLVDGTLVGLLDLDAVFGPLTPREATA